MWRMTWLAFSVRGPMRGGGGGFDKLNGVAVDSATNAVVAVGYIESSPSTLGDVELTPAGSYDGLLWKLNSEGTTLWAVRGGGTGFDQLYGVAVDAAGAVVGRCRLAASHPLWKAPVVSARGAIQYDETLSNFAFSFNVSRYSVVAAGAFQSTTATFGDVSLTRFGSSDTVLWKLSKEGTTLWAVRGGGTNGYAALKAGAYSRPLFSST